MHKVLADITPMVEPIGLDEAFVDVAGAVRLLGSPAHIAQGLRRRVHDQLHLECAVGIGRSKMIAKLASRAAKPRASRAGLEPGPGVFLVEPADELEFLHGHAVEALWGVGPATAKRLHDLGVRTVGDLAALPLDTVVRRLGKASGAHLAALSRGEDPDPVNPNRPNKSIGHEETFSQDLVDRRELERHVLRMAESVATMLRGAASSARTITVKIKFKDLSLVSRSHTMERPITTGGAIGQVAAALLAGVDPGEGIRLLGVSASGLAAGGVDQLSFDLGDGLTDDNESATAREQSWQDATTAIDAIRDRFGRSAVGAASMVTEEGIQVPARRDAPWGPDAGYEESQATNGSSTRAGGYLRGAQRRVRLGRCGPAWSPDPAPPGAPVTEGWAGPESRRDSRSRGGGRGGARRARRPVRSETAAPPRSDRRRPRSGTPPTAHGRASTAATRVRSVSMSPRSRRGGCAAARTLDSAARRRSKRAGLSGHWQAKSQRASSSENGSTGERSSPTRSAMTGKRSSGRYVRSSRTEHSRATAESAAPAVRMAPPSAAR